MYSSTFPPIKKKGQDLSTFESFYQIILDYEDEFSKYSKELNQKSVNQYRELRKELLEIKESKHYWCSHSRLKSLVTIIMSEFNKIVND